MKKVELSQSLLNTLSKEQYISFFMLMRMLSVLNRKEQFLINFITKQDAIIAETIDVYCDLLSTYNEASKEYFTYHIKRINSYLKVVNVEYEIKMASIFSTKLTDVEYPFNVFNQMRNVMAFHFKNDHINKYYDEKKRLSLIGFLNNDGNIILSNTIPFFVEYLSDILNVSPNLKDISKAFRTFNNDYVRVFLDYLNEKYHAIITDQYTIEK
jgi:hypothetical protein